MVQAAGCQAVVHDFRGSYRSHVLADSKWTIWHSNSRQGAFLPPGDWQQAPTKAYYMTADHWPLAVLMNTICAASRQQDPGLAPLPPWSGTPTRRHTCKPGGRGP